MQASTENDFLEETLRRVCGTAYYRHFRRHPEWIQWSAAVVVMVCMMLFAGWIRYFFIWWDWKRRNRYRIIHYIQQQ
jgi:hypothetical protein